MWAEEYAMNMWDEMATERDVETEDDNKSHKVSNEDVIFDLIELLYLLYPSCKCKKELYLEILKDHTKITNLEKLIKY